MAEGVRSAAHGAAETTAGAAGLSRGGCADPGPANGSAVEQDPTVDDRTERSEYGIGWSTPTDREWARSASDAVRDPDERSEEG